MQTTLTMGFWTMFILLVISAMVVTGIATSLFERAVDRLRRHGRSWPWSHQGPHHSTHMR